MVQRDESGKPTADLYRDDAPTPRTVFSYINESGDVVVELYDHGPECEKFFGKSDYERSAFVSQENKDALIAALTEEVFGRLGESAWRFDAFCENQGVSKEDADPLVIALIEKLLGGQVDGVDKFLAFCKQKNIPCHLWSW